MKTEKHYLILPVIIGILCVPALGELELPRTLERGLIGQANPALAGIDKLSVRFSHVEANLSSDPNKGFLVWNDRRVKVEKKLKETSLKVASMLYYSDIDGDAARLDISMKMLKPTDSQQCVFWVQTSLARLVYLAKDSSRLIYAEVWKVGPKMDVASIQDMPNAVTNLVVEQVEVFVRNYLAANPEGGQAPDANNVSIAPKERAEPAAKPAVAKYKYVASKNSKVFHKPECSSANRISPKNLVGYNSRDEAIRAGKRPCKICKP